jgi:branched-chain amino acid transport system permease protein
MAGPGEILQYLVTGLTLGGIYALIALGFVLVYNVTGILNFTQGEFAMLGALLTVSIYGGGLSLPLSITLAVLLVAVIGGLFQRLAIDAARNASVVTMIIITIGAAVALRGIGLLAWGTNPYILPAFSGEQIIRLAGAAIIPQSLWVLGIVVLVVAALFIFFELTYQGKALRACAVNQLAARLMGISPRNMAMLVFGLAGALGALAGIVISPITMATYDMGLMLGLKGFVAAVIGGLTSPGGAVLGGLILGIIESLGAGLVSSHYKDLISFVTLLLVLLYRPEGLLGFTQGKRV